MRVFMFALPVESLSMVVNISIFVDLFMFIMILLHHVNVTAFHHSKRPRYAIICLRCIFVSIFAGTRFEGASILKTRIEC